MFRRSDPTLLLAAVLAVGSVGIALVLQHGFGIAPCAWCTFQRLLFLLFGALAALGWLAGRLHRVFLLGASALAGATAIGGLWAALHQQFVASRADSCAYTFADRFLLRTGLDERFPSLFEATASCADANVPLLGIPFALWSAALFALLALLAARAILFARPARRAAAAPEKHR